MNDRPDETSPKECLMQGLDLHKSYKTRGEDLVVLADTNLQVYKGEVLGIVGASGVGKSTLLHVLGGLDCPDAGRILFRGDDIYGQGDSYLDTFRNSNVGFVFQLFNLLGDFTALENAMFPALIRNENKNVAREKAEDLLVQVGLKDRLHHKPAELSGGEIQRVALARGLVNRPELLLADEPTGNLDTHASDSLMELILNLNQKYQQTFVIVTHSQRVAGKLDRILELADGAVRQIDKSVII